MTILEALYAEVDPFSPSRNLAIRALEKVELTYTDTADSDDDTLIATAAVDVLSRMLVVTSESEGGFSQSYDKAAIRSRIQQLCSQYGIDASAYVTGPAIYNSSTRW